jgi:putative transposase
VIHVRQKLDTSERLTCKVIGLARSTLQYKTTPKNDDALRLAMIRLAKQYGRYGYRKVAKLLRIEGWHVNHKKVERLWQEEGLQLPHRHRKRKRLYHKDSSIIRLRPTHPNHVWGVVTLSETNLISAIEQQAKSLKSDDSVFAVVGNLHSI